MAELKLRATQVPQHGTSIITQTQTELYPELLYCLKYSHCIAMRITWYLYYSKK